MKRLKCPECQKYQKQGKYCLDCGQPLKEIIDATVKFKPIKSSRNAETLKRDIRTWLGRIGVQQPDVKIRSGEGSASVDYILGGKTYTFNSHMQDTITDNLAAVEQFLHYRVLGIERGIETTENAFKGYEQLPDYSTENQDPYAILGFVKGLHKQWPPDLKECEVQYRKLAKQFHPDTNFNDAEAAKRFGLINEAIKEIRKMKT